MIKEIKKKPDQDVIEHLEAALAQAKSGELQGIITIKYWDSNCTTNGWAGLDKNSRLLLAETLICTQLLTDWYVQKEKEQMSED